MDVSESDLSLLASISQLVFANPFSPHRIEIEKEILGGDFVFDDAVAWSRQHADQMGDRPNVLRLKQLAQEVVERIHTACQSRHHLNTSQLQHYWDTATYLMLYKHITPLVPDEFGAMNADETKVRSVWQGFKKDYQRYYQLPGLSEIDGQSSAHLFACLNQVHCAFINIFNQILGDSRPAASLRERVWESIFTCDARRYYRSLYRRLADLPSLITGPSGTGKELVARAIGNSQYVEFDPQQQKFRSSKRSAFIPLNLSALSPTLIESELFGHRKGAFTGAIADRVGWLESCQPHGAVFLDEIGELDLSLQVKLLRVVQHRTYCRIGETEERRFFGKLVAATNRNLAREISLGTFREDFFYRLCTDRIETPSLRQQLDDRPEDLFLFVKSIAQHLAGDDFGGLAQEATGWIEANLGRDYPWNGNIRELEQCVSSILIRRSYQTEDVVRRSPPPATSHDWLTMIERGEMNLEELMRHYTSWIYREEMSYEKTAARLGVDRRTVKAKVDSNLLKQWGVESND